MRVAPENAQINRDSGEEPMGRRIDFIRAVKGTLDRIEERQSDYGVRLSSIENKINSQLEVVASNTTSMAKTLEAIQVTNSKLVDAITNKNSVPTLVMLLVITMLSTVFLVRELALSGGRAKISLEGVDISSRTNEVEK